MLVHMIVSGRVQGVGFRYSTQQKALELQLTGWVQNQNNGTVIAEVKGEKEHIEKLILQMKKGFHRFMHVDDIQMTILDDRKDYQEFRIR